MRNVRGAVAICAGLMTLGVQAADEPELGWSDQAELSYVLTAGNSESSTLGFKNELTRTWETVDRARRRVNRNARRSPGGPGVAGARAGNGTASPAWRTAPSWKAVWGTSGWTART